MISIIETAASIRVMNPISILPEHQVSIYHDARIVLYPKIVNLLDDYTLLYFDCLINFTNKNKFLNNFSLKTKKENQNLILKIRGTLNILNKKINFKEIKKRKNYLASKEDLKYFKDTFETIFLSENYLKMFSLRKIKEFIVEIS